MYLLVHYSSAREGEGMRGVRSALAERLGAHKSLHACVHEMRSHGRLVHYSAPFLTTFASRPQSSTLASLKTLNMSKSYDDIIYHVVLGGDTGLLMSADQYVLRLSHSSHALLSRKLLMPPQPQARHGKLCPPYADSCDV